MLLPRYITPNRINTTRSGSVDIPTYTLKIKMLHSQLQWSKVNPFWVLRMVPKTITRSVTSHPKR